MAASEIYLNDRRGSKDRLRLGIVCEPVSGSVLHNTDTTWNEEGAASLPPTENWRDHYVTRLDVTPFPTFEACIDNTQGHNHASDLKPCLGLNFKDDVLVQWRFDREIILCDCLSYILCNGKFGEVPSVFLKERASDGSTMSERFEGLVPLEGILEWWTGPRGAAVSRTSA